MQNAGIFRTAATLSLAVMPVFAANTIDDLKKNNLDGASFSGSAFTALQACQPLAPSPFGNFVPSNVSITVPGQTITVPGQTVSGGITSPVTVNVPSVSAIIPGTAFLPPAPRDCSVSFSGNSHGDPGNPGGQTVYSGGLLVDFSTYRSNGSGGGCSLASGTLTVAEASGKAGKQVTMVTAGLVCDVAGIGSPKTFNGTYLVTGGTDKYNGASGTGNVTQSFDPTKSLLHLDGNILFSDK